MQLFGNRSNRSRRVPRAGPHVYHTGSVELEAKLPTHVAVGARGWCGCMPRAFWSGPAAADMPQLPGQAHAWAYMCMGATHRTETHVFMRMPGVEPGSQAWEACMMPLHYMRSCLVLFDS